MLYHKISGAKGTFICCLIFFINIVVFSVSAQPYPGNSAPEIGAQIWLEPGQKAEDIDNWFRTLAKSRMPVTRLFMMWNFIEVSEGKWDFSLYDAAFKAAEKHKVKIIATLMPNFGPPFRGYFYKIQDGAIPKTDKQLKEGEVYIKTVVERYAKSPSLDTWMLMNEPGQYPAPDPLALERYIPWLKEKYGSIDKLNQAWLAGFSGFETITYTESWGGGGWTWPTPYNDWNNFWREHLTWYMNQVNNQIKKYDSKHLTHVNPHGLLEITSKYDLPGWSKFLGTLGASIHPVWHFGMLPQNRYTQGVSFVCDMIRGSAYPKPFWVTELQGGHNIYTANLGVRPTPDQVKQWVWTSVGAGAKRVVFWCLNARSQGTEAGEWAMLDYQNQPTERLTAASEIAELIQKENAFFENAEPVLPDITILLSIETMQTQERSNDPVQIGVRKNKAHKEAVLGVYRALQINGITPQISFFDNYQFETKSARKRTIILPHATVLTDKQIAQLTNFANAGNKVIVTGLSGFYNESEKCRFMEPGQMKGLTGGLVKEIAPVQGSDAFITISGIRLPFSHFVCELNSGSKKPEATINGKVAALRNSLGKGEVFWIPACIDVAAFEDDAKPLANFLKKELSNIPNSLFAFKTAQPDLSSRVLTNPFSGTFGLVVCNTGNEKASTQFEKIPEGLKPRVIYGNNNSWSVQTEQLTLKSGETVVLLWEK